MIKGNPLQIPRVLSMPHNLLSGMLPCPSTTPPPTAQLGHIMRRFLGSLFAVQYGNSLLTVKWSSEVSFICIFSLRNHPVLSDVQCLNIICVLFQLVQKGGSIRPLSLHFDTKWSLHFNNYFGSVHHVPGTWDPCFCRALNQTTERLEIELVPGTTGFRDIMLPDFKVSVSLWELTLDKGRRLLQGYASSLGAMCIQTLISEWFQGLPCCLGSKDMGGGHVILTGGTHGICWGVWGTWEGLLTDLKKRVDFIF